MLAGRAGEATALCMRIVTGVARAAGAERLQQVVSAHADGCLYHGIAGLDFTERLVELGGKVAVRTTLNVGSLDLLHPGLVRADPTLATNGRRLEVMLGYSDSAKDVGPVAATLALYEAQTKIAAWADANDIRLTLFHGRGGALGRGGGPAQRAIMSQPPHSVAGRFKVTEQGEVIQARYGEREIAARHIDQVAAATLLSSLPSPAALRARSTCPPRLPSLPSLPSPPALPALPTCPPGTADLPDLQDAWTGRGSWWVLPPPQDYS